jgi:hypothetical protein
MLLDLRVEANSKLVEHAVFGTKPITVDGIRVASRVPALTPRIIPRKYYKAFRANLSMANYSHNNFRRWLRIFTFK